MISFRNVSKSYGARMVLQDVNFQIQPGEFVCITGKSGAGKSTIVHLIIRAEIPSDGVVEVDGKDLGKLPLPVLQLYRRRTGVVFQDGKLLSDRTVAENVAFAMEVCGDSDDFISRRVPALLERVGLRDRADAFPHELSGGERARAAIARALVHQPMIVIADEPTGNIDPDQAKDILALFKQVHAEGVTVILATHDSTLLAAAGPRVLRVENGQIASSSVQAPPVSVPARQHTVFEEKDEQVMNIRIAGAAKETEKPAAPDGVIKVRPISIDER